MNYITKKIVRICVFAAAFCAAFGVARAYAPDSTDLKLLERKDRIGAKEYLSADSSDKKNENQIILKGAPFTPAQDSAFYYQTSINIPVRNRLDLDLRDSYKAWSAYMEILAGKPWQTAMRHMREIPESILKPTPVEMATYQHHIRQSMYVPGVRTLPPLGTGFSMEAIKGFLGVSRDFSPVVNYRLEYISDVEIVVYSIKAIIINTIFKGKQPPGEYSVKWNGRNDDGSPQPSGDYVIEVRIDGKITSRKVVILP